MGERLAGMTRNRLDKSEAKDFALGGGPMRPRDAATLIILEKVKDEPRVLMGKRAEHHAFMPGKFVFPGGRTDPHDGRVAIAENLHEDELEKLLLSAGSRANPTRAKAIAMSAIRETYEEAGLLIGKRDAFSTSNSGWQGFSEHGVAPSLAKMRLIARAITPPGRVRRFDTRFFAIWRSGIAVELPDGGPTNELQELLWLPISQAKELDIPMITRTVLEELQKRLESDPALSPAGMPVPFYHLRYNRFIRELL
jgi:8-oxo-dGTP pyrophosphatase MutT (NUDIX family)